MEYSDNNSTAEVLVYVKYVLYKIFEIYIMYGTFVK